MLALRAEAFKQFNEAAVIQTVLGMLPEIVRVPIHAWSTRWRRGGCARSPRPGIAA
ncbi:MAG: hypothetical protein M3N29_06520 [Chloroflexota bacterium]|nr:hypothetical protein [Chloroflexota bacterium]